MNIPDSAQHRPRGFPRSGRLALAAFDECDVTQSTANRGLLEPALRNRGHYMSRRPGLPVWRIDSAESSPFARNDPASIWLVESVAAGGPCCATDSEKDLDSLENGKSDFMHRRFFLLAEKAKLCRLGSQARWRCLCRRKRVISLQQCLSYDPSKARRWPIERRAELVVNEGGFSPRAALIATQPVAHCRSISPSRLR